MKAFTRNNPYVLGLCGIPIGLLLGQTMNKWLGIGIIVLAAIFTIICLQQKRNEESSHSHLSMCYEQHRCTFSVRQASQFFIREHKGAVSYSIFIGKSQFMNMKGVNTE